MVGVGATKVRHVMSYRPAASVALSLADVSVANKEPQYIAPTERAQNVGGRNVRVVDVYEKLELDLAGDQGIEVRFRVSIVPERDQAFRIHIKGLNCFVSKAVEGPALRPTPAISAAEDGAIDFVSTSRKRLGRVAFSFGRPAAGGGRVFPLAGGDLVVPLAEASYAVALDLGPDREIIVMCKRT